MRCLQQQQHSSARRITCRHTKQTTWCASAQAGGWCAGASSLQDYPRQHVLCANNPPPTHTSTHLCSRSLMRFFLSSASASAKMGADQASTRSLHLDLRATAGSNSGHNSRQASTWASAKLSSVPGPGSKKFLVTYESTGRVCMITFVEPQRQEVGPSPWQEQHKQQGRTKTHRNKSRAYTYLTSRVRSSHRT